MPGHGRGVVVQEREKVTCQMQGAGVELVGGGIIERGLSLVGLGRARIRVQRGSGSRPHRWGQARCLV